MNPAPPQAIPRSVEEANRLVTEAEGDGKGVPILLRQYLKLNAKLLGFNVDLHFGANVPSEVPDELVKAILAARPRQ
jgi:hypothetical protein